jgi:hypothetical protein
MSPGLQLLHGGIREVIGMWRKKPSFPKAEKPHKCFLTEVGNDSFLVF